MILTFFGTGVKIAADHGHIPAGFSGRDRTGEEIPARTSTATPGGSHRVKQGQDGRSGPACLIRYAHAPAVHGIERQHRAGVLTRSLPGDRTEWIDENRRVNQGDRDRAERLPLRVLNAGRRRRPRVCLPSRTSSGPRSGTQTRSATGIPIRPRAIPCETGGSSQATSLRCRSSPRT